MGINFQVVVVLIVFALTQDQLYAAAVDNRNIEDSFLPQKLSRCLTSEIERKTQLMNQLLDDLRKQMKEAEARIAEESLDVLECDSRPSMQLMFPTSEENNFIAKDSDEIKADVPPKGVTSIKLKDVVTHVKCACNTRCVQDILKTIGFNRPLV